MCQTQWPPRDNHVNCDSWFTSLSCLSCFSLLFLYFYDSLYISHVHFFLFNSTSLPPAKSFPDRLVMFVLQKLENSNERSRVGSLAVLRHLINSTSEKMLPYSPHTHLPVTPQASEIDLPQGGQLKVISHSVCLELYLKGQSTPKSKIHIFPHTCSANYPSRLDKCHCVEGSIYSYMIGLHSFSNVFFFFLALWTTQAQHHLFPLYSMRGKHLSSQNNL